MRPAEPLKQDIKLFWEPQTTKLLEKIGYSAQEEAIKARRKYFPLFLGPDLPLLVAIDIRRRHEHRL